MYTHLHRSALLVEPSGQPTNDLLVGACRNTTPHQFPTRQPEVRDQSRENIGEWALEELHIHNMSHHDVPIAYRISILSRRYSMATMFQSTFALPRNRYERQASGCLQVHGEQHYGGCSLGIENQRIGVDMMILLDPICTALEWRLSTYSWIKKKTIFYKKVELNWI